MPENVIETQNILSVSVLDEHGNLDQSLMPNLSPDDIRTMYWFMNLSRILNSKILNLQKQGRIGTYASIYGQEGGEVALAYAMRDFQNVWVAPSFRETAVMIARGVPMDQIMRYWGGYEIGSKIPKEMRILPVCIPIGTQLNHAVGLGMAMQITNEKGVSVAMFGDGGTSEGESMEAMNFAGAFNAPVIFFCQNNQYAISVPRKKQSAAHTLAQKAMAFGFQGVQVDGNDPFAIYRVARQALEKAYNGGGPTFIEAVTYRLDNHTTADDWHRYRKNEEVEAWMKRDPLLRMKKFMYDKGMWNDEHEKGMIDDATRRVEEAAVAYETTRKTLGDEIFDFTFAQLPPILQEQKEKFRKMWSEQQ